LPIPLALWFKLSLDSASLRQGAVLEYPDEIKKPVIPEREPAKSNLVQSDGKS
jgi:hypothetical protein